MKNKKQIISVCLFFAFLTIIVNARPSEYQIEQLKIENGLSNSTIFSMLQDKEGFMWFGTASGLNKYDGYKFTVYNHDNSDSTSISDNVITAMLEDENGYIWIGTRNGVLNKFNRETETFENFNIDTSLNEENIPSDDYYEYSIVFSRKNNYSITSIAEDKKGNIWIGTWGKGIIKFDKKHNTHQHFYFDKNDPLSLSYNRITSLLVDDQGNVWVGTFGGGLNRIIKDEVVVDKQTGKIKNQITFEHYRNNVNNKYSISDDKIISLYEDRFNSLWIGTFNGGLNKLNNEQKSISPKSARFVKYLYDKSNRFSLSNNTIMAITEGQKGELWIGTFGGGLDRYDYASENFVRFIHDPNNLNSIGDNDVLSLLADRSGIIWVGTELGDGISKLSYNAVKFDRIRPSIEQNQGLSDNVVWAIYNDTTDYLWVGTYRGGLDRVDKKTHKVKAYRNDPNNQNTIGDNHIRSINKDTKGNLWIGTYSKGLDKFDLKNNKFYHYRKSDDSGSIGANQIQSIYIDKKSNFWIGTFGGGLNTFNENSIKNNKIEFKKYLHDQNDKYSLSDNRVYTIYEDSYGILWVGTLGGGLNKFDKKRNLFFHFVNQPNDNTSLSDNRILNIYEDSQKNLWIGTYGGGLNKFNRENETFNRYSSGVASIVSIVYGIEEDNENNLWLSSDNGIFKFNIQSGKFVNYDLNDGVQSLEFSGGAYCKSSDGYIYFGGINGINYFHPDSIFENTYVPPVVITSIKVLNKPIKGERKNLTLPYNKNFVTFEFSSLDYTNPIDNHYMYMLQGLDKDWQVVDASMRMANYTDLSPGDYVFKVKGSNNDNLWNIKGAEIYLTILPPFWTTWWFIILCLIFASTVIYYLSTLKYRNLLSIEKLKTRLAADLHDNIGSGLTEISILSELAAKDVEQFPQRSSQELKTISDISRQLVDGMSDIVWIVNPKRDSLYDLMIRLKDSYNDLLASLGIAFKTNNIEKLKEVKLPIDIKQNLYLIFKEGLNNSIKHSKCTKIHLEANLHGDVLELSLSDNGVGITNEKYYYGNGMKNIETRAISIGGKLKWRSTSEGTVIRFVGKIGRIQKIKTIINKKIAVK